MKQRLEIMMKEHGVKPTAMRMLVLRCIVEAGETLTLRQIEEELCTADRSTIFRTLCLFEQHHLLHSIHDGSGSVRYEACHSSHNHENDDDRHPHFRCLRCGRTICISECRIPKVELPEGFQAERVDYVVTGVCAACSDNEVHLA